MELENTQKILQDAGIEVDVITLQNPTEEFMIELIIKYFKLFQIDGDLIAKPTPEEIDCVYCEESALTAIKAINLHAALVTMCDGIVSDLALTDITSPGCKRLCKRIRVLFNFFIYMRNKMMEKEHLFEELQGWVDEVKNMIEQKEDSIKKIGAYISEHEDKLELKKKINKQIAEVMSKLENDKKVKKKLQLKCEEVSAKQQELLYKVNDLKTKTFELHKITKELQSKVVQSPDEYLSRNTELKKIIEQKMEDRQNLTDSINRKKNQIQSNELADSELKNCYNRMIQIGDIMKKLKETTLQIYSTTKQMEELKDELILLERRQSNLKHDSDTSETLDVGKNERLLSELLKSYADKQREYQKTTIKLKELREEQNKIKTRLQQENEMISSSESEYNKLLADCKNHFDNLISEELDMRKDLEQLPK